MPQTQGESTAPDTVLTRLTPLVKELGASSYALAVGALYVSGFLVLNSNLANYGVLDIEFVNARYFLAGATFVFFLVCFYLFAGRAALFSPKWLREDLERLTKDSPKRFWSFIVFAYSFITAAFFMCLSASLFTLITIGSAESGVFLAALIGHLFLFYTFDVTNLDVKFPRFSETVIIVFKLIAIYAFFAYIGSGAMLTVFISYAAIFFFINQVLDSFTRYKLTADRITFNGIYAVVFLLVAAIGYGILLYGQVSSKLGSARPQAVLVVLSEETRKVLPSPFAASASQVLEGNLIHQTPEYIYITSSEHTVRLRAADVVALVSTPEPERGFWNRYFQRAASAPSAPDPSLKGTGAEKPAAAYK